MNLVRVVIPIYKTVLDQTELLSLKRSIRILKKHPFTIVCPEGLDLASIKKHFENVRYQIKRFPPVFFKNIDGYNRLMLSRIFYDAFYDVDYILICQTDVLVVRDELDFWCSTDFDYIGAPWLGSSRNFWNIYLAEITNFLKRIIGKKEKRYDHLFKVGNGGFSLRKVKKHKVIVSKYSDLIDYYIQNCPVEDYHIEDVFFSIKAPQLDPDFAIPEWKTALKFCIDRKPKLGMEFNQGKLPFAIHGFNKPKVQKFWKPIIKKLESVT